MYSEKLRFQKWDMAVIAGVLLLAVLVFLFFLPKATSGAASAQVYLEGTLVKTVALTQPQEFTVTGAYTNRICVRDGKIAVIHSDCPGGDCISCGWIGSAGRSVVCLPNALEIRVVSANKDVDFAVG